jgi:hypothetical protein
MKSPIQENHGSEIKMARFEVNQIRAIRINSWN